MLLKSEDWEAAYHQLGYLISDVPDFDIGGARESASGQRWLGRANALLGEVSGPLAKVKFESQRTSLLTATSVPASQFMKHIMALLYTGLAEAEMKVPSAVQGSFIPAGSTFDALAAIAQVLQECGGSAMIVDPYMDQSFLTDFARSAGEDTTLRLLSSPKATRSGLPAAVDRWRAQYEAKRPIELRIAASATALHDRLILGDSHVWQISQSFNGIAARSPASVIRITQDVAALKREAYEALWASAAAQ